jgi:tRNA pseudouridine13 synthase
MRPITHIVGKYLVKGDFEKAVMSYIANPIRGENEDVYKARQFLQETYDFAEALKQYPDSLHYEKAILNELVKNPDDFVNSLKSLPKNLLTLFVHAYQSYLFNQMLSERIKRKLPLNKAEIGDIIFPIRSNKIDEIGLLVTASNIDKVNKQITKGKAFVSGLLIGSDSTLSQGTMGEIENDLIEQERLDPRDFIIPEISFLSSSGSRRSLLASLKKIDWKITTDEINKAKFALTLKFELQKGCYATSLLREFMKVSDIKKY